MNLLTKKLNKDTKAILEVYKSIKNNFKIIYVTEELTERSMQTLVKYKANIGFSWFIKYRVMKDLNIYEIVSFDPDFDNKEKVVRIY